jgi:hypothetical protein
MTNKNTSTEDERRSWFSKLGRGYAISSAIITTIICLIAIYIGSTIVITNRNIIKKYVRIVTADCVRSSTGRKGRNKCKFKLEPHFYKGQVCFNKELKEYEGTKGYFTGDRIEVQFKHDTPCDISFEVNSDAYGWVLIVGGILVLLIVWVWLWLTRKPSFYSNI